MVYSLLSLNGHLYQTDTSVKRTPRVGPCLCLLPLFDSLQVGHLGRFPFVRTDRPDPSRSNENFTFDQNYPTRSVKS